MKELEGVIEYLKNLISEHEQIIENSIDDHTDDLSYMAIGLCNDIKEKLETINCK